MVYFVNLPDGLPSSIGTAYIFRNGIAEALSLACGAHPGGVEAVRLPGAHGTWRNHREITLEALRVLERRPRVAVLLYDPGTATVMKCRTRCTHPPEAEFP
jgi:hypothetical protein